MQNHAPIRVLIADDHPLLRTAIRSLVENEQTLTVVAEARNGLEAVDFYRTLHPDVVLMDLKMPLMNGLEATQTILSEFPEARIIFLTSSEVDADIQKGLDVGAMGYILKDAHFNQLFEAIQQVYAGKQHISKTLAKRLAEHAESPKLSRREIDVLKMIKSGTNNRAIGLALGITESTVKSHIKNILAKLDAEDRTQAVIIALRRGIIRQNDDAS